MNDYQAKCKALSEFYAKAASTGKSIEYHWNDGWDYHSLGPTLKSDLENWRLEPSPRKAYVVWLECHWYIKGISTIAPTFDSFEEAESWNNENVNGKGKIQEIVCPE